MFDVFLFVERREVFMFSELVRRWERVSDVASFRERSDFSEEEVEDDFCFSKEREFFSCWTSSRRLTVD